MKLASSSPVRIRISWPVAAFTRARKSGPLPASRTALVATRMILAGENAAQSASSSRMAARPRAMPSSLSTGLSLLMPALMRASSVLDFRACSRPAASRCATSILIELLPISMTATGGILTTDYTDDTEAKPHGDRHSRISTRVIRVIRGQKKPGSQREIVRRDEHDEFALEAAGHQLRLHVAGEADVEGLMKLRDFLGDADHASGPENLDNLRRKLVDAVAAFVERQRIIEVTVSVEKGDAGGGLGRQKTNEEKSIGRQTCRGEHGGQRAGPGDRYHGKAAAAAGSCEAEAGITQARCARIADDGNGLAGGDEFGESVRNLGLVVLVIRGQLAMQAEPGEHGARSPGVFASHKINAAEDGPSALREVGEVAERGCDDVEMPGEGRQRSIGGRR